MIGFHGIGILFHGICISFRCISLHFMNFVTFRFMSSKRYFATDGAPYYVSNVSLLYETKFFEKGFCYRWRAIYITRPTKVIPHVKIYSFKIFPKLIPTIDFHD